MSEVPVEEEELVKSEQACLFPEDHKYFTFLKKVFRHEFRKSGFRRISTGHLLSKKIYEDSGQIEYNKHSIDDDSVLKFDSNLAILNCYIENNKQEELQPVYYYYIDQLFGLDGDELKEEHTIGGEIIGEKDPILDMECIFLLDRVFKSIGLEGKYSVRVNSLGLRKEQLKYKEALVEFYADKKHLLTEESIKDLETEPLKLLTPKSEDEEVLLGQAPKMRKFLKKHSKLHLEKFEEFMEMVGIDYTYDDTFLLKRGYYTNTIWEITETQTGNRLACGGRYDNLSTDITDLRKEIPATGFSTKIQAIISMLKSNGISIRNKDQLDLYFVQLGDEAKKEVFPVANQARSAGINTLASLGTPSMKEQMLKAQRSGATFVIIVGIMEARNGRWQLRNMDKGTQDEIKKEDLLDFIVSQIGKENLDFYSPVRDLTIGDPIIEEEERA